MNKKRIIQLINMNNIAVYVDFNSVDAVFNDEDNGGAVILKSGKEIFLNKKSTQKALEAFLGI